MKKQALKAVTMLVSIIALAFMTAVATNAQSGGNTLKANIPFDFVVGDKTLAAGEYNLRQINADGSVISVRGDNGKQAAIRLTNTVRVSAPKKRAMLTFHRYGGSYFLAQVWTSGSLEGREMIRSKSERAAERELAKNPSGSDMARNATYETVTIFAEFK